MAGLWNLTWRGYEWAFWGSGCLATKNLNQRAQPSRAWLRRAELTRAEQNQAKPSVRKAEPSRAERAPAQAIHPTYLACHIPSHRPSPVTQCMPKAKLYFSASGFGVTLCICVYTCEPAPFLVPLWTYPSVGIFLMQGEQMKYTQKWQSHNKCSLTLSSPTTTAVVTHAATSLLQRQV